MKELQIMVDSSCDLPEEIVSEYNIHVVPFYVSFNKEDYFKEKEEISISEFYSKLQSEKIFPKTSLPSVQDYLDKFVKFAKENKNIICICLTDKFSGSYQSAMSAKELLEEEYPDCKITVINSISATAAEGLLVIQAAKMQQQNMNYEEIVDKLEKLKVTSRVMFTIGTLEYLQKGGRIGKVSALAGNILNLKPLIVLNDGELQPYANIRGSKKALKKIIDMTKEHFAEIGESFDDYEFAIITGTNYKEAESIKDQVKEFATNTYDKVFQIGVTIGTYTGPDLVCISFIKKYDSI